MLRPVLERHGITGVERFAGIWTGHRTQHHAHPEYQMTVTVSGVGRFEYLGGVAMLPPDCTAFFHPCEPHVLANADRSLPWSLRSLHIPPHWLEHQGKPLLQPAPLQLDEHLRGAFDAVWTAFEGDGPQKALVRLATILRGRPGLEPMHRVRTDLVRRCLDHLASVLDRPVSCVELARVAKSSPSQIRRALVAATGLPPNAWHLQRRVDEAKHRLRAGVGILDVALATGFADQAHFTRHFTKLVGVSPSRYVTGIASCN